MPGGTANWTFSGGTNYTDQSGTAAIVINKATATIVVTPYSVAYDVVPHTATGTAIGVLGEALSGLVLTGTTHTNVGSYPTDSWSFTNANYANQSGTVTDVITARPALVAYIGQTTFVTSGSSATTAQVTLSASVQDPTGRALTGATVNFIDANGSILARDVKVSPVANAAGTGTANATVTLSTGQYGAESYLIRIVMTGNYDNAGQIASDKTATVTVMKPASTNETIGAGTFIQLSTAAGQHPGLRDGTSRATFTVGLAYNKSETNLQGRITLYVPQQDGSVLVVKSNSLSSMAVVNSVSTIYAKCTATLIKPDGSTLGVDGGASLRLDAVDGSLDQVGFTVLSAKDSTLWYSNNWQLGTQTGGSPAWRTVAETLSSGSVAIK